MLHPALSATCAALLFAQSVSAATTSVNVGDDFFSPASVTVNVNDTVEWTWIGNFNHSSTSTGALWDSGIHGNGWTFTHQFTAAGSFPYRCLVHAFQTGSVVVQAANSPPSVAMTWPTNSAIFAAPWTGPLRATASATGGSVTRLAFYSGTTLLGTVTNPGPAVAFPLSGLGAGSYSLSAVATDNRGATNSTAPVGVTVVTPATIQVGALVRSSPTSFHFAYTATPGLAYIVEKSTRLPVWTPVRTNLTISSPVTFVDNSATGAFSLYAVRLAPNP